MSENALTFGTMLVAGIFFALGWWTRGAITMEEQLLARKTAAPAPAEEPKP